MIISHVFKQFGKPELQVFNTEHFELEASLAVEMAHRWGMVSAMPDGEDSSGRAKLRLLSEEEVVERACRVAALLMRNFRENDLIHKIADKDVKVFLSKSKAKE